MDGDLVTSGRTLGRKCLSCKRFAPVHEEEGGRAETPDSAFPPLEEPVHSVLAALEML